MKWEPKLHVELLINLNYNLMEGLIKRKSLTLRVSLISLGWNNAGKEQQQTERLRGNPGLFPLSASIETKCTNI